MTVGLVSLVSTLPPVSPFRLILSFNPSVASAPSGFTTAMQTAANMIMSAITQTTATVTIQVGWGEILGLAGSVGTNQSAGAETNSPGFISYATLKSAFIGKANTPAMNGVAANLPTSIGPSTLYVPRSVAKVLGVGGIAANDVSLQDGAIGIGTGFTDPSLWVGLGLHEMTHAMGRIVADASFVFSRFTSAGNWYVSDVAGVATYFSIDGGVTKLADYSTTNDPSDFLNWTEGLGIQDGSGATWDAFDAFVGSTTLQYLTPVDIKLLNAMGFQ